MLLELSMGHGPAVLRTALIKLLYVLLSPRYILLTLYLLASFGNMADK